MAGVVTFTIELEREDDGRWVAEVSDVPGALAYGASAGEAAGNAVAIAIADQRLEDEADERAAQEAIDEMARTGEKPIPLDDVKRALKLDHRRDEDGK